MNRRGTISTITNYTIEELVELMLVNDNVKQNVRLYQRNDNMNVKTQNHAKAAYKAFLRKKEKLRTQAKRQKEKDLLAERISNWNTNNPLSFRYRTVEEIYVLIRDNSCCFELAWNYVSPCKVNSRMDKDVLERVRKGLVRYYKKKDPTNHKLQILLERDPAKAKQNDT